MRLLEDDSGYYFSVGILIGGTCAATGVPCYGATQGAGNGQWPDVVNGDVTINGTVAVIGRSLSEPRPLNCFAARTIPITHWSFRAWWDATDPPGAANLLPIPATLGTCGPGGGTVARPSCLFPPGLSVTIQGIG